MWNDDRTHVLEECHRLLDRLLDDAELAHTSVDGAAKHSSGAALDAVRRQGLALWDVFSDNHSVVDAQSVCYSLGSFRGSGGEIADALMRHYPEASYDYLDFYMGSMLAEADLTHEYRCIFARLRAEGCDWIYSFPRLYGVRFERTTDLEMMEYDPSRAVAEELDQAEPSDDDLMASLDGMYEEAVAEARYRPVPTVVAAYRSVFGRLPEGWPHPDM
jgi:hypothetical protein